MSLLRPTKTLPNSIGSTPIISHKPQKVNHKFSRKALEKDILANAKAINFPIGAAETFATKTADYVEKWIKGRATVTQSDLNRVIAKKLSEYNKDLAFFYKNNGKII